MNKENIKTLFTKWMSSWWAVPAFLFVIAVLAFGLLIPKLGFYMDDWHFVYYAYSFGLESLQELLLYDSRPYATGLYTLGFMVLGFKPIAWHISVLILRAATAFVFFLFFQRLWPSKRKNNFSIALIFLVFPYFLLQPMAVAYFIHWVGFLLYALSMYLMLLAFESSGKKRFLLTLFAVGLEVVHLFSSEYFAGLSLLRLPILWSMVAHNETTFWSRLKKIFVVWLPYLVVFGAYTAWRGFFFVGPIERNTPVIIDALLTSPIATIWSILVLAIKDAVIILFSGWFKAFAPAIFDLSSIFSAVTLALMSFVFVVLGFLLPYFFAEEKQALQEKIENWRLHALVIGVAALVLGELPVWMIGRAISTHSNQMAASRFGLASMLGAAILFAVAIDFFVNNIKKESLILAITVSLAIGVHLHNAHDFERSWEKQQDLYQQLSTRIPALKPQTMLLSANEILFFMGEEPTANVVNIIYSSDDAPVGKAEYWFASIYASYIDRWGAFLDGMPIERRQHSTLFQGNSHDMLLVSYEPGLQQCLWVLRPEDNDLKLISEIERESSQLSSLERIDINAQRETLLPPEIFGTDVPRNWCSYYQRADLARQRGNWQDIITLWEDAQRDGKQPANGFEYIPFIEGYAHQNNWTQVKKLTRTSNKISQGMYHSLCPTLQNLEASTPASSERDAVISDLYDYLKCQ